MNIHLTSHVIFNSEKEITPASGLVYLQSWARNYCLASRQRQCSVMELQRQEKIRKILSQACLNGGASTNIDIMP